MFIDLILILKNDVLSFRINEEYCVSLSENREGKLRDLVWLYLRKDVFIVNGKINLCYVSKVYLRWCNELEIAFIR